MKFVFIISLAAVLFAAFTYPESKEPELYLGHAQIFNKKNEHCIVRAIYASNQRQADSLFMVEVKYYMGDTCKLRKDNYSVWLVKQKAPIDIEKQDTLQLKPF